MPVRVRYPLEVIAAVLALPFVERVRDETLQDRDRLAADSDGWFELQEELDRLAGRRAMLQDVILDRHST